MSHRAPMHDHQRSHPHIPAPEPQREMTEEEKMMAAMGLPTNFSSKPLDQDEDEFPPLPNKRHQQQGYHHRFGPVDMDPPPSERAAPANGAYGPEHGLLRMPGGLLPAPEEPTRQGINGGFVIPHSTLPKDEPGKKRMFTGYNFVHHEDDVEEGNDSGHNYQELGSPSTQPVHREGMG